MGATGQTEVRFFYFLLLGAWLVVKVRIFSSHSVRKSRIVLLTFSPLNVLRKAYTRNSSAGRRIGCMLRQHSFSLRRSRPSRYRWAAFEENVVEYKHMRLCHGMKKEFAPCEFIDKCDLCINSWFDYDNDNEHYIIMMGALDLKCKRDNPNFKPLTRHEFFEIYKKMKNRTSISVTELLESAIDIGAVGNE
mgnify:CR=1 FL=1